jgi:hypothetical protein
VTEGDGAAVHVDLREVEAGLLRHGEGHDGEGLVDLEEVDVVDGQPELARVTSMALAGRRGEPLGRLRGAAVADDAGEGGEPEALHRVARGEHEGRGAVVDLARVGGGDGARLVERGRAPAIFSGSPREAPRRPCTTTVALLAGDGDGDELGVEAALALRGEARR